MTDLLTKMKADAATDLEVARARQAGLDLIAGLVADLRGLGFAAELEEVSGTNPDRTDLALRVDLFAIGRIVLAQPEPGPIGDPKVREEQGGADPAAGLAGVDQDGAKEAPETVGDMGGDAGPHNAQKPDQSPPAPMVNRGEDGLLRGPWSEDEDDKLIELALAGRKPAEIAADLGRPKSAVSFRRYNTLKARIRECQALAAQGDADGENEAEDTAAPDEKPSRSAANIPTSEMFTAAERAINAHLNALGYASPPWSPLADLYLAEALARGDGAGVAATDLGVTKDIAVSRWRAMNVSIGDIDHQQRLMRVLRWRSENASLIKAAE